jgi:hypothetical protein
MSNEGRARILFLNVFQSHFLLHGPEKNWLNEHSDEVKGLGMSEGEAKAALSFLKRKELLEQTGSWYGLSDLGLEACVDSTIRERCLSDASPRAAPTINVGVAHAPFQIGDGNTQTITYSSVLQNLVETIEQAPIPPEAKKTALEHLGAVLGEKALERVLDVAVGAGALTYLKSKLGLPP